MSPSKKWLAWEQRWKRMERVQNYRVSRIGKADCFCTLNQDLKIRMKRTLSNKSPLGVLSYMKGFDLVPKNRLRLLFSNSRLVLLWDGPKVPPPAVKDTIMGGGEQKANVWIRVRIVSGKALTWLSIHGIYWKQIDAKPAKYLWELSC